MKLIALATAALLVTPAFAASTTIDFEGVTSFASIGATYAALGVNFGPDAQGLVNDALGPYFSNAPTPVGVMFVSGVNVPDAAMDVAAGFRQFSFFYSSEVAVAGGVQVWSGAGGTGSLLAAFDLEPNATRGCTDTAFCNWNELSRTLSQTARSVTFGAGTQTAAFDNISAVPEPTSVVLAGIALGALAVTRRRA